MFKILSFFLCMSAFSSFACNMSGVIGEISKYHGPAWETFKKTSGCSSSQIKNHLRPIIEDHERYLGDYDYGLRALLYRNAVKSYGEFVSVDKATGSLSPEDKEFYENFYENPRSYLGEDLFTRDDDSFRIKILESMKNTGSLDALDFFADLVGDENTPPFLAKEAYEFGEMLINGQKRIQRKEGDRIYEEDYYANLKNKIEKRFSDKRRVDDTVKRFEESSKEFFANASGDEIRSRVIQSMGFDSQGNRGPSSEPELSKLTMHNHHHGDNDEKTRKPQSLEEEHSAKIPWYYILTLILAIVGLVGFFIFRRK